MRCETAEVLADGRIVSPSAERNKGPIAEILMRVLPAQGEVLEVSSGTGQHVLYFAQACRTSVGNLRSETPTR